MQDNLNLRQWGMEPESRFQILSIDGGGIKGLFSAALLAALEEDLSIDIRDHFDLISGTSTGGIIALALGHGIKPRQLVEFYVGEGPKIFGGHPWLRWGRHLVRSKYEQEPLKDALQEVFGEVTLAESGKRLIIPCFSLDSDEVYVFKTPHHERLVRDGRVPMWQVALATTAAPTYFPASLHTDSIRLIDGGVWANNPAVIAIAEAMSMLGVERSDLRVLSLGTTSALTNRPRGLTRGGLWAYRSQAVDIILGAQARGTVGIAQHLIGKDKITRVDPDVPAGLFKLDRSDPDRLYALAREASRKFSPTFSEEFVQHIAAEFFPNRARSEQAA